MTMADILNRADLQALEATIKADPACVDAPVCNGDHAPHPIHALCDRIFDGRLSEAAGLPLVSLLIASGANLTHVHAANGDGLLTSAISLSCPKIAQALLDAGAPSQSVGLFGATPLYWAAIMGMPDLVQQLKQGANLTRRDAEFDSTPLGWAVEGWAHPPSGSRGGQIECARLLVDAGSVVEPQWKASDGVQNDEDMAKALRLA